MKMLVEIDVEIIDPTWTVQDLRENLPTYMTIIIQRAEAEHADRPGNAYIVDTDDLAVWLDTDYLADIAGIAAMAEQDRAALAAIAALPAHDRQVLWMAAPDDPAG